MDNDGLQMACKGRQGTGCDDGGDTLDVTVGGNNAEANDGEAVMGAWQLHN